MALPSHAVRPLPSLVLRGLVEGVALLLRFRGYRVPRKVRLVPVLGPVREYRGWPPMPPFPSPRSLVRGEVLAIMPRLIRKKEFHHLRVEALDQYGDPAEVFDLNWSTDNPNVLRLVPWSDGRECFVLTLGPIGDATVTFEADADPSEGVSPLIGSIGYTVVAGLATNVQLVGGAPQNIDTLPPDVRAQVGDLFGEPAPPDGGTAPPADEGTTVPPADETTAGTPPAPAPTGEGSPVAETPPTQAPEEGSPPAGETGGTGAAETPPIEALRTPRRR